MDGFLCVWLDVVGVLLVRKVSHLIWVYLARGDYAIKREK